jgi:hypothetical protein
LFYTVQVGVTPDGASLSSFLLDLSTLSNATEVYACFSPLGASGPFYASNSTLLTVMMPVPETITPNVSIAGCGYVHGTETYMQRLHKPIFAAYI